MVLTPRQGHSEDHLQSPQEFHTLCSSAPPLPQSTTVATSNAPTLASQAKLRQHLAERQKRLLTLYVVDVEAPHFQVAAYDERKHLLTLVSQPHYALFDGHYAIELHDDPLLAFDVKPSVADTIQIAHSTGRAVVRLYVVLDALHDPDASFCSPPTNSAPMMLRGRLVGSRLWHTDCAGEPSTAFSRDAVLAEQRVVDAAELEQLVGEHMDGRQLPKPYVHIDRPRALGVDVERTRLLALSRDAELLLLPCFLKAMGQLGSQKAALVLEAHFDAEGTPRDTGVAVDAAGSKALEGCTTSRLGLLRLGPLPNPGVVRLNVYFNRR
ncbi:MAG: hypothetical protein AAFX99_32605 [Myxococcota bacterium]